MNDTFVNHGGLRAVKSHTWPSEQQRWDAGVKGLPDPDPSLPLSLGYLPPPFNVSVPIFPSLSPPQPASAVKLI